jgi:GAF domain-containing protein
MDPTESSTVDILVFTEKKMKVTSSVTSNENRQFSFWSNLPLARKQLLAFGTLFVLGLAIAASGLFGLNRVQNAYADTLAGGIEIERQSGNLSVSLLGARRREKDFLLRWQTEGFDTAYESYVVVNQENTAEMKKALQNLAALTPVLDRNPIADYSGTQYEADIVSLNEDVLVYEKSFASAVNLMQERGFVDTGLEGEFRTAVQTIEVKILDREGLDKLVITMLNIRRREKDYLLRGEQQYVDNVHELVTQLKTEVSATDSALLTPAEKSEFRSLADEYLVKFDALVAKDAEVATEIEVFRAAAADIQDITEKLKAAGVQIAAQDTQTAQTDSSQTFLFTSVIVLGVLVVSIVLSIVLSRQITAPIISLTNTAQEISAGKFDIQAQVNSADEIGTLAQTFNSMTSQLGKAFEDVTRRGNEVALAAEVGRSISQVGALDVILKNAAEIIRSRFDLYYAQVYLTDASQTNLILQAGTGTVGVELLGRGHRLPLNTGSINGRAATEKHSVVIADTATSATFRPNPLLPDTRSEMAVPLIVGEKVVGVLDLQSDKAHALDREILPAFEALAGQFAIAIQNASLLAEAEQARAEVEAQARRLVRANWAEYLDAIHKPEETGFVFEQNQVMPLTQGEQTSTTESSNSLAAPIEITGEALGSLVVELEGESSSARNDELINIVARQVAQHIEGLRLLESAERYRFEAEEASRRLTREGWKTFVENTEENLGYFYDLKEVRPHAGNGPDDSAVALPLKVRDEVMGKLAIQGLDANDSQSLELVNAVAERLSAHIESLRQFEETKRGQVELDRRAQQLAAVAEISTASSKELNIQKMLESVVHLTQRKFSLYHAHIFTFDEMTTELQIAACGWKEGDEHEGTHGTATIPMAQEQSLVARAARSHQPVIVNDVKNEPGWLPNPLLPDTQSEMAVPLIIGDQLLGVLDVQSDRLNAFSQEDASIHTTLAAQIATALQNARSFEQAQLQAERESMLNTIGQKIQSATSVEAVLQIAARELGRALGAPLTVAQLGVSTKAGGSNGNGN